jgi:anti-sigma regulatory factor (Ser/Thr protein kinase)
VSLNLELTLANQRSAVGRLQDQMEAFGREHGVAARELHGVQLALEEHLTNVLCYAYDDEVEHQIRVRTHLTGTELRVEVEDDGRPFNPLAQPEPDLSKAIEERRIGGLGIHMMRKSLDRLEYRREAGRNVLVMIQRLGVGASAADG